MYWKVNSILVKSRLRLGDESQRLKLLKSSISVIRQVSRPDEISKLALVRKSSIDSVRGLTSDSTLSDLTCIGYLLWKIGTIRLKTLIESPLLVGEVGKNAENRNVAA